MVNSPTLGVDAPAVSTPSASSSASSEPPATTVGDDSPGEADEADQPGATLPRPRGASELLAHYRVRGAVAADLVVFDAACPACGGDSQWLQEREDTRLCSTVMCPDPGCR